MIAKSFSLGVAAALLLGTAAVAQTTLSLSEVLPDGNFMTENAKTFAEAVREATDGQVVINVAASGSLGFKGPDQLGAVRDGLTDMADVNISQQVGVNPMFGAEGVPFLVRSMDELKLYHQFLRPEIERLAEENNQKVLYMVPSPAQYIYLKTEVDDISDLRGISVRGADKNTVDIVSSLGMEGVAMPWGELLPALASGRVNGVATSSTSGVDGKFWEFMDYIYPTNHTWGSNAVTINLDSWNRLTPEQQGAIEDVAASLEPGFWDISLQSDLDSIAAMTENGMTLVELPDQLRAQIDERAVAVQEEFFARVPDAKPIADEFLAARDAQ